MLLIEMRLDILLAFNIVVTIEIGLDGNAVVCVVLVKCGWMVDI